MTIKELYEYAIANGFENYRFVYHEECDTYELEKDDLVVIHNDEVVMI